LLLEPLEGRCLPSTVTNLSDHDPGSLRDAIATTPAGGTVDFQSDLRGTIPLTTGELAIGKDLTIAGPGSDVITVSGNHQSRVFDITTARNTVTISALTIAGGFAAATYGGAISNIGTLTVNNSIIRDNSATGVGGGIYSGGILTVSNSTISSNSGGFGGGIDNGGMLTVYCSTFIANSARGGGGGIYNEAMGIATVSNSILNDNTTFYGGGGIYNWDGTVTVSNSTLTGNSAKDNAGDGAVGGGIFNFRTLTVNNCTLSSNSATDDGGGIDNIDNLTLSNSTLSGNSARNGGGMYNRAAAQVQNCTLSGNSASNGGGMYNGLWVADVRNTIVAGNTAAIAPDLYGSIRSHGHNLIGDGTGGNGYNSSDLVGTSGNPIDPKLGPLQDNGGPTPTMAPLLGSPAIAAGDITGAPRTDQRGAPRIFNDTIDIGAYEVQAAPVPHTTVAHSLLWPPDQRLVNVGLDVQLNGDADPSTHFQVQVYADDQADPSDATDIGPGTLQLRAARNNALLGRVYLIVTTATDASGQTGATVSTVVVPGHNDPFSILLVRLEAALAQWWYNHYDNVPPDFQLLGSGPNDGSGTPFSQLSDMSATLGDIFRLNPPASDAPLATYYDECPIGLTDNTTPAELSPWASLPVDRYFTDEEGFPLALP
jgi:hypothetical protein